jgi:hypothetical protein
MGYVMHPASYPVGSKGSFPTANLFHHKGNRVHFVLRWSVLCFTSCMSQGLISLHYKVRVGIWIHAVILMTLFTCVFSEVQNYLCVQHSYCNRYFEIQNNSNRKLVHWHCHTFEQYNIPIILNTVGHLFFFYKETKHPRRNKNIWCRWSFYLTRSKRETYCKL